jgi:hypothetical protein
MVLAVICAYNTRQVLALGKSGTGLPLHKSEKTENYCSVMGILFIYFPFLRNFSKQDFSLCTLYICHSILSITGEGL